MRLGFHQFRVRHHGDVARIEIAREEMPRALTVEMFDTLQPRIQANRFSIRCRRCAGLSHRRSQRSFDDHTGSLQMKVLVIGSGGREHAIVDALSQNSKVSQIYAAPGNGGIAGQARLVPISADDNSELLDFARQEKIDLTFVGPEVPSALASSMCFVREV